MGTQLFWFIFQYFNKETERDIFLAFSIYFADCYKNISYTDTYLFPGVLGIGDEFDYHAKYNTIVFC